MVVSYRNSTSNHNDFRIFAQQGIVVSYRNSTSNHNIFPRIYIVFSLYLIEILHQTTTSYLYANGFFGCILSKFYIKPQQRCGLDVRRFVVSYRNSTSNHNIWFSPSFFSWLYLIEILHQTTTSSYNWYASQSCILSKFYIKPQHLIGRDGTAVCCILSKFYIKPQLCDSRLKSRRRCILSKFYIKPQLVCRSQGCRPCCILSKFYIKPQLRRL